MDYSRRHQMTVCMEVRAGSRWRGAGYIDASLDARSERGRTISSSRVQHVRRMKISMGSGRNPSQGTLRNAFECSRVALTDIQRVQSLHDEARLHEIRRGWRRRVLRHLCRPVQELCGAGVGASASASTRRRDGDLNSFDGSGVQRAGSASSSRASQRVSGIR
jgi:hypothetical protein